MSAMKDDDKSQPYKVDPEMSPKTEESLQQELRSKNVAELCKNESSGSSLDTLPSKFSPSASGTSDGSQSEERKADDEFKNRSKLGHSRMAIRSLILSEYLAGHRPSEAVENVRARSTRKNLGYDTVRAWYKKFDEGDTNLSDGPRSGRPAHVDVQKLTKDIKHHQMKLTVNS
ncbi:unnamed protein product [Bursaphelenchus okinawaensis]|uniref:Mos1 transposase HTH domain-containing protein n=1 Tax=Bursaphelenchus okinawaensis TaxID=465554 RepID=A0A811K6W0_9BILA|nr:unnamed protein product [Bursaphelenchus okinawaensis]CAG9094219.1 unnamed protein product [Bursaphelenchus okinawaensis]